MWFVEYGNLGVIAVGWPLNENWIDVYDTEERYINIAGVDQGTFGLCSFREAEAVLGGSYHGG